MTDATLDNAGRAATVADAVKDFELTCFGGLGREDRDTVLGDLIANLLHYAVDVGADWREVVARGVGHFRDEVIDEEGNFSCELGTWPKADDLGVEEDELARRVDLIDLEPLFERLAR